MVMIFPYSACFSTELAKNKHFVEHFRTYFQMDACQRPGGCFRLDALLAYDEAQVASVRKRARSLRNIGFIVATGGAMSAFVRQSTKRPRVITCSVCG